MSARRLLLIDDNVRGVGGHFFELMTLIAQAGHQAGFEVHAAIHESFTDFDQVIPSLSVHPVFKTRRMVRWSMGVDGNSRLPRNSKGEPMGRLPRRLLSAVNDGLSVSHKRSRAMLGSWQTSAQSYLRKLSAGDGDRVLINTADDFSLLAMANVLEDFQDASLDVSAIVHFALVDRQTRHPSQTLRRVGEQLRQPFAAAGSGNSTPPHDIKIYATTQSLTDQYRAADIGIKVIAVDYPTRIPDTAAAKSTAGPVRCVLAGLPRAEKGRESICGYLRGARSLLDSGQCVVAAQMPANRWRALVPKELHTSVRLNEIENPMGTDAAAKTIDIQTSGLGTRDYHKWLNRADLGIFLYDPDRYESRASGVLLELMVRGVAVIVPDRCHMAEELRRYGGNGFCGWIYRDRKEIPGLMSQYIMNRIEVVRNCHQVAKQVAMNHDAATLLKRMRFVSNGSSSIRKAA